MNAMREAMEVLVLQILQWRCALPFAIHPHYEEEPYHLPHQALWFVLMLIALFLLSGRNVAALQCVIA